MIARDVPPDIEQRLAAMREAKRRKFEQGRPGLALTPEEMTEALGDDEGGPTTYERRKAEERPVARARRPIKHAEVVLACARRMRAEGTKPTHRAIAEALNLAEYQVRDAIYAMKERGEWSIEDGPSDRPKPPSSELTQAIKTLRSNVIAPTAPAISVATSDLDDVTTELDAMRSIVDAVKPLAQPARQRVIYWASATLGGGQ
jgi:hypothetical protein